MALTLKSGKRRVFKLGFPLKFKREGSELIVTGSFSNDHAIKFEQLNGFEIRNMDGDGFVLFEVSYSKPAKLTKLTPSIVCPQAEAGVNGYTLFHSSVPRSSSYGHMKSNYEYYKRSRDLSYYALITKEGVKPTKIIMGGIFDPESRINQFVQIIYRNFDMEKWFDRKMVSEFLPLPLSYCRVMKSVFDILVKEKFLTRDEAQPSSKSGKGRKREIFRKTEKLTQFMVDPRSFQKSTGVNVEQLALTSDQ